MVDSIAPIAPAVAVTPVQPTQNTAAASSASGAGSAGVVNFAAFQQAAALQDEVELLDIGQSSASGTSASGASSDSAFLDGAVLANLSPQALSILSEVGTSSASGISAQGSLTPAQLEEVATLQFDAQMLNGVGQTTTQSTDVSLVDSGSTVNLSQQAVAILDGINPGTGVSAGITVGAALTTAQIQQIAGILAPFVSQPLTQDTLIQMQNALIAAGFNPIELSLQTIILSMNYLAEFSPEAEELAVSETTTAELMAT